MAVSSERVTVGTSAVALNAASTAGMTLVMNTDVDVAIGASDVTVAGGFLLLAVDAPVTVHLDAGEVLYGISGSSSVVHVLRT